MKRQLSYLVLLVGVFVFASVASAHLMEVGTSGSPISIGSDEVNSDLHVDADPFKGSAEIYAMNTGTEDWVGFKFKIIGDLDPIENVDFVDFDLSGGEMNNPFVEIFPSTALGHTYEIDNSVIGATIEFDFSTNVTTGQLLHFTLYTDNTTDESTFGLCMMPVVPEPATMTLLGFGGLAVLRRKR